MSRFSHGVLVTGLLAVFVVCGFFSLRGDSATFDETAHVGAGVAYLESGDFRLNPEHPPLVKMLAAVPLVVSGRGGGRYGSSAWTGSQASEGDARFSHASQFRFGFELLNGPRDAAARRDPALRLTPARCAVLVLGVALALVIYFWARALFGPPAGLLALALAVTCPTLLAHARLVTTDLAAALGFTATMWLTWRWAKRPSWGRAGLLGLSLGAALLFKFSCALLVPLIVIVAAVAAVSGRVDTRRAASGLVVIGAVAYASIWAGYGFRFAASADPDYVLEWDGLAREGPVSPAIRLLRGYRVLPEAYTFGLAYAKAEAVGRVAFLDGEESQTGWYRYFPEAFFLKTPLAFTVLAGWVLASSLRRTRGRSFDGWCVAAAPVAFAALAIASRFNIGHRHLTPVYPFLCIAMGSAASWLATRGSRAIATAALVGSCVVSFALAGPGYLSYFNIAAGGPRGGAKHLVDSNLDWGQDLARLKRWMTARGVSEIDLAYFGTADPRAYDINFRKVALFFDFYPELQAVSPEPGRYVAVSATLLAGVYLDVDRAFANEIVRRGFVPRVRIEEYLADAASRRVRGLPVPHLVDWMTERKLVTEEQRRIAEDAIPASRITRLRDAEPIGWAGDSIAIYLEKGDTPL